MNFSEDQLRENYKKFRDEDLIRIAELDAESLTPEALQILKDEIGARRLQYRQSYEPSFLILEKSLLDSYCNSIQDSFCPNCNVQGKLNRIKIMVVAGIGHFYIANAQYHILCRNCSQSKIIKANIYNLVLGLWTIFPALTAINNNILSLKVFKFDNASELLVDFVKVNYRKIEALKGDIFALSEFIKYHGDESA